MGPRPLLAMALGWVLVVGAVAAVTFVVVDRAGRGVGQASAARTVAPLPSAGPTPTPGSSGTSGSGPSPVRPSTASFPTQGGTVVASCEGSVLALESITVRDGWRFEKETEHGGLEVRFRSRTGDVDDVEVVLACVDGVPTRRRD